MHKWLSTVVLGLILVVLQGFFTPVLAQDDKLSKQELDQLLAPIALYPDDLLTNVLMASTYPLDVVQAARWVKEPANAKLKGDALTKALESRTWDPSIKALVQFPTVLQNMSDKLEWTQKLGDAFLAQQDDVMDQIQFLRQKADEAGNLKSTKQQTVSKQSGDGGSPIYVIEPANPDTVYVPYYQPAVVYGDWWYDDYPPYYWGYPGASYINGWWWGTGVAIAAGIWGWNHCDWRRRDIDIDVNKWNNINNNRNKITNARWEHRPDQRGSVPYGNKDVRNKFANGDRQPASKDYRGFDRDNIDRSKVEARLKDTDHSAIKDEAGDRTGDNLKGRVGDKAGDNLKGKVGDGGANLKNKAGDRGSGGGIKNKAANAPKGNVNRTKSANANRPQPQRPSPGAFDVKRGSDVRQAASRGHASRVASGGGGARNFVSGGPRGGGGGMRGGGGGRGRR